MRKYLLLLLAVAVLMIAGVAIAGDGDDGAPSDSVWPTGPGLTPISLADVPEQNIPADDAEPAPMCVLTPWTEKMGTTYGTPNKDGMVKVCSATNYTDTSGNDPSNAFGSIKKPYGNPTCFIKNASVGYYLLGGHDAVVGSGANQCLGVVSTLGYSGCVQGKQASGRWANKACHAGQRHLAKQIHAEADYLCDYTTIPDNKFRYQYFVWVVYLNGESATSASQTSNGVHVPFCHA